MAIPVDAFGRTGHKSSRSLFGADALARLTQDVADRTLEVLLRHGVNHIDTAASYGDAELRIRPWLKREPGRFFLATKTDARTKAKARDELHRSLERLGVDPVDLWQLHHLAAPTTSPPPPPPRRLHPPPLPPPPHAPSRSIRA